MKKDMMALLVCPVCKGKLELKTEKAEDNEVVSGALYCVRCKVNYPITDTIPVLLPPERRN
jgi:uncharacterized protein YbaR (Trm112 family)